MKVLHLLSSFFPEYTGSTIRPYNLLSRLDHEVEIITPDRTANMKILRKNETFGNIEVHRINLDPNNLLERQFYIFKTLFWNEKVIEDALKHQYDIIHGHNLSPFGYFAQKISKKNKVPFVLEIHGPEFVTGTRGYLYTLYLIKIAKMLESSKYIIVLTESLKNYVAQKFGYDINRILVVPNGVDTNKFSPRKDYKYKIECLNESWGISDKVITYAGIMDKINGIDKVSEILVDLIKEEKKIKFLFVGLGPEANKIISIANKYEQVKYIPSINYNEMPFVYQLSDIFIIPRPSTISSETVTPLKLLEAMSMGCIVLGSNVGGINEVLNDGVNGYLFKKGDMMDFKQKLLKIINEEDSSIGKKSRESVITKFNWDKSRIILENIYEDVIERGSNGRK